MSRHREWLRRQRKLGSNRATVEDIDRAIQHARMCTPPMEPVIIGGKPYFVLIPREGAPDVPGMIPVETGMGPGMAYPVKEEAKAL